MKIIYKDGTVAEAEQAQELEVLRHTAAHIMAQAVKRLYPHADFGYGPATEKGFYYDIDLGDTKLTDEDLAAIEAEMKKIVKENLPIRPYVLSREEAIAHMQELGEKYKVEHIGDLDENAEISFFKQGDYVDMCTGPHLCYTKALKAFKITGQSGAYWKNDKNNKMLTRIYGTAFKTQDELDIYLKMVEEAERRDHNKLGRELGFFTTVDAIGQGLPVILPKGSRVIQLLQRWVEDVEQEHGYLLTKTPLMAKRDLYRISGHWDHYRDGMFILGDADDEEKECLAMRPMTCPFQYQVYLNQARSYRELP
ncbi:MAG: threonine--tRNA ligase, partial [Clostridia bacterium]|nr:threonine--tRNA ligase [Clostridia bacterium]